MILEWTGGGLPWAQYKGETKDIVLKMKNEARSDDAAKEKFVEFRDVKK